MMGRPAKTLADHVRRRNLPGPPPPPRCSPARMFRGRASRACRAATGQASSEPERRAIARRVRTRRQARPRTGRHTGSRNRQPCNDRPRAADARASRAASRSCSASSRTTWRTPQGPLLGQPFKLEPWQKKFLREFYRRDQHGGRVYRRAVLGVPRGNGKTAARGRPRSLRTGHPHRQPRGLLRRRRKGTGRDRSRLRPHDRRTRPPHRLAHHRHHPHPSLRARDDASALLRGNACSTAAHPPPR